MTRVRILRHVANRLHGEAGFVEPNVHTLDVLLRLRPESLESLRYGIGMGRH